MNRFKCIYAILDFNPVRSVSDTSVGDTNKFLNGTNQELDLVLKGLDGSFVYAVNYKDISAAVSNIDKDNLKVTTEYAFAYEKIIESIMARYALLPMRFGTLVKDEREVIELLEEYYDGFVSNLRQVKGKLEYGLKVLSDIEEASLESETGNLNRVEQLKGDTPYKKYLLEKLKEHKFEEALMRKVDRIIKDIHHSLEELSFLSKFKKMSTERIILDATYLVKKETKDTFIQKFKELEAKHPNLKFLLTGPWPPYNFIDTSNLKKRE